MAKRYTTQIEHDQVILASAATYDNFRKRGYSVSTNLSDRQCHDIGGGIFPDLVVWRPHGEYGKIIIIEEVETSESVNYKESEQWKKYANFKATFYLIVPKDYVALAQEIIAKEHIKVDILEYYYFDDKNKIRFSTRNNIPLAGQ